MEEMIDTGLLFKKKKKRLHGVLQDVAIKTQDTCQGPTCDTDSSSTDKTLRSSDVIINS